MSVIWSWLKKNWKWLLAPLWVASMVLAWLMAGGERKLFPSSGTTDEAADKALEDKDKALEEFRQRLDELYARAEERLNKASEEQLQEFQEVKKKSLEEMAQWIDALA